MALPNAWNIEQLRKFYPKFSLSFFYFFILFSPHFFRHEDDDGKVTTGMWADAGVCKDI
jgi:hypothetical protein